jgi:hypothetical protein
MGLSYDVTFISVLLHNIAGIDVVVEKQHCITHCIRSKQMANVDELTRRLGALNTILAYYKCTDDIQDGDRGRAKRLLFSRGFQKARHKYPEIERIVKDNLVEQEKVERAKTGSLDRAADASATMMAQLSKYFLKEKGTEHTERLFYTLGKWIYLIDALDDYDKDKKKNAYNPFVLSYQAKDKNSLMQEKSGDEIRFVFNALFFDIRENLAHITFPFNRDLSDNILLRGLPATTKRIMDGCTCKGNGKGIEADKGKNTE